ncbi:aromatic ring-hydroxylating dioxygenase subunit alpha [Nostoc sp. WHI]|uniref:aromatic ring-hydroxylating dioxygenase subunit alpha n=1 Tax=Nostoc sp. WHI TaxID=2650611 RepID=UPI0018C507EA|nr:aromatic ring-hydroxylating dioxygenase subunit alpha [Nostoc sp. WHI]MBG1270191.1 aromatic ring-hydroxylating dioxygenase subunit alpha [Nostoc sp. WHI]
MTSILEKGTQSNQTKSATVVDKNPLNLAASWYVAMLSKELGKKPKAIQLFGQDLVAWRDKNGTPVIMERYCSHMGASLAIGEVKDGCIQCPFHHWRYDNEGNCVSIPDIENIPPTARQATYVIEERYGYIWVWYGTSSPLFPLPKYSAAEDEKHNYMSWRFSFNTKGTVPLLVENLHDSHHLDPVHTLPCDSIQLTILDEQHSSPQFEPLLKKAAWFSSLIEARIKSYVGPLGAIAQVLGFKGIDYSHRTESWPTGHIGTSFLNGEVAVKALIGTTPVAENQIILHELFMIKKSGFFLLNIFYYLFFGWQNQLSVWEDVKHWNTMKLRRDGAYVKHDRGVLKFREFYQSWVNKVEV